MNHFEIVKAAVVKACPEILELKEGCWIRYTLLLDSDKTQESKRGRIAYYYSPKVACVVHEDLIPDVVYTNRDIVEILGCPIQLADVLRAMPVQFSVGDHGVFFKYDHNLIQWISYQDKRGFTIKWNLSQPLSGQSEETLKFLAEILK